MVKFDEISFIYGLYIIIIIPPLIPIDFGIIVPARNIPKKIFKCYSPPVAVFII